ncbi:MAG: family 2 glycosyl transferase [Nitrospira bacterium SG8_35_4]|nr:MAG: family 2 glycosyl transferase [Nitrospira bacterium SG8_35_4]
MNDPLISLIIRCCNEQEHIGRLLSGIFEQTVKSIEVIIVDSGSTDDTLSIASCYPVVIHKIRAEEFSFGHALNTGCKAARGEILVFASAHVYPTHRRWLEYLVAPFSDPKVAMTYGKQRGNELNKFSEHQIFSKWFPEHSVSVQRTPFCNNANAAILRSLWEQIPYDEGLTGLEDIDWAKRMIARGYYLAYVAEADVIHVHNEKYSGAFNRYYRESIVFYQLFPEQKFRMKDFLWLCFINTMNDYIHALRVHKLLGNLVSIPVFRLMQFWGTYKGYVQRDPISSVLRQRFYYPNGLSQSAANENRAGTSETDYIDYMNIVKNEKIEHPH